MKRKFFLEILGFFLGLLLLCQSAALASQREPVVGQSVGNLGFSDALTLKDAIYLGLAKPGPFTLTDIGADYVLVESFNTTCPHSRAQAPFLNALFKPVGNNPKLKNKLKFLAVAEGQNLTAAWRWKRFQSVPFPVVPDIDAKFAKALNFSPYPVTVVLNKNGKIVWVHIGFFENTEGIFMEIAKVVGVDVTPDNNLLKDIFLSNEVYSNG